MMATRPPAAIGSFSRALGCSLACIATATCFADVSPVEPFTGAYQENSNQHSSNMSVQVLPVFGGLGELANLSPGGAIKVEFASNFNGDQVVPISGMMCGQLGIGQWTFDKPVARFGGWFENNGGADDATVEFYDANDELVGEAIADIPATAQQWTWNGWEFDVPVTRIVVTGNGVLNGFLWYENLELDLAEACATDLDGDGTTDGADLGALLAAWGSDDPGGDLNGDGTVDGADVGLLLGAWGPCVEAGPPV